MKKVILFFAFLLTFSLIPLSSAFAYEGGLLNGALSDDGKIEGTDNDYDTAIVIGGSKRPPRSISYSFSNPVDINSYYLKAGIGNWGTFDIIFYDSNGNKLSRITDLINDSVVSFDTITNVSKVSLEANEWMTSYYTEPIYEFDVFGSNAIHDELSNLVLTENDVSIFLDWNIPVGNSLFTGTKIFKNGSLLTSVDAEINNYTDSNITPDTAYTYTIVGVYSDGVETNGIKESIVTSEPKPIGEVTDLEKEESYDSVKLSWKNPEVGTFRKVKIYRKLGEPEPTIFETFFSSLKVSAADTSDEYNPMFETNGSYWKDLTVQPEKTYEYKLSTVSIFDVESEGVTITATTEEEPTPEMGGVVGDVDEKGDYTVKWSTPTDGQVKVLVGGKEYKIVDAGLKTITIPAADLKYTITGKPDVKLVPISESGKVGEETNPNELFSGIKMPFANTDLLKTGLSLLKVLGPIVLLALAFLVFPKLKRIIEAAVKRKREREGLKRER